ncbi:MAG: NAD(P)H-quinone oxidoreductase [Candidatus Eremiobacteraeota bacterium]|nr:NAD(P)H-quinone oxidoreductase [Candidatus Eremiobacteraeota bacterium]
MKALHIASGNPPGLDVIDRPTPTPGPNQVLVRVLAAGVNRADLMQLRGKYPIPPDAPADIPGLEFAGIAESLGSGCSRVIAQQRVFGLCSGGAHAQYVVSPEELLMAVPDGLNDVDAAAVPEAFITAHDALITQAALHPGERVLAHAVASSVGLAAVQLAHVWGCEAFGTSRSSQKLEAIRALTLGSSAQLAANNALDFVTPDSFDEHFLKRTAGRGVDVILDPVGADYFERNLHVLAPLGRLIVIATMGGSTATLPLTILMRKRLRLIGTMLRSRALDEKAFATRAFERDALPRFTTGQLKPIVDRTYPLEHAAAAYTYMEENRNLGKIVLTMT